MNDCQSCERMKEAETEIKNLKEDARDMNKKLDKLQWWIMTTFAAVTITLVVNLLKVGGNQ